MLPTRCINACQSAGYKYAGAQDGNQCFCGNSYGVASAASLGTSTGCTIACAGNSGETCGGIWENSGYATGLRFEHSSWRGAANVQRCRQLVDSSLMKKALPMQLVRNSLARIVSAAIVTFGSSVAHGAPLTGPITGWSKGDVPSTSAMYEYVPATAVTNPPILVVSHQCGGTAAGMFSWGSGLVSAADQYGFVIVYPQTSNGCWDVSSDATQKRDGGGDSQSIIEMVNYSISTHSGNANRVYATGVSSGAMMTELLLAVYPDVFKAGSEFSGVQAGCSNIWDLYCGNGSEMTGQWWGDKVRAMYPGYAGYRPRIQLWHGDADTTIDKQHQFGAILEWTNVLGLNSNPKTTTTETINSHSLTHETWQDSCGYAVLDAWMEQHGPHNTDVTLDAAHVIPFLGLDQAGPTDPEVARCGTADAGAAAPTDAGSDAAVDSSIGTRVADASDHDSATANDAAASGSGTPKANDAAASDSGTRKANGQNGCSCTIAAPTSNGKLCALFGLVIAVAVARRRSRRTQRDFLTWDDDRKVAPSRSHF